MPAFSNTSAINRLRQTDFTRMLSTVTPWGNPPGLSIENLSGVSLIKTDWLLVNILRQSRRL
jgi:hypothetical protein